MSVQIQCMYSLLPNIKIFTFIIFWGNSCLSTRPYFLLHKKTFCFVCKRGYTKQVNYGALLHSSMSMTNNTTQYHGRHPIKGFMPSPMLLVFLTPRQALSSHPRQQMVWLYCLQDSMPNWCTIKRSTMLHTHDEIQWPTAASWWHFALRDVSRRQSAIFQQLATPGFPQCDHTVDKLSDDAGSLCSEV